MSRLFDHLGNFGNRARTGRNMSPRLGIIVPYRDRADHLDEFLSEMMRFFAADPINAGISPRFLIVEQAPGLPFNRGALLNVGFRLLAPVFLFIFGPRG